MPAEIERIILASYCRVRIIRNNALQSSSGMPEPVIVPRSEHPISRRNIDADAVNVLYRLHQFNYIAYLVGGSVRDLLLGRQPKDFDVGTSAHPYQIKKLFRNCWIIGRRFRLAHVRFGPKTIEVATFRRSVPAGTENEPATEVPPNHGAHLLHLHHENTFGTPEEDAFRRDFTINALFYDIATFSIIDYVGGLRDLQNGVIRSIGDPAERFQEDPVRMFRAVAFAARLGFRLDKPVVEGIRAHRHLIASASPSRLIEEYYKVLRSGAAAQTFRMLAEHGLLEPITPELHHGAADAALWHALDELDRYRLRFDSPPVSLTNSILLGTLLVPLGLVPRRSFRDGSRHLDAGYEIVGAEAIDGNNGEDDRHSRRGARKRGPKEPPLKIGMLPVARRDTERLRQILIVQRRLLDLESSPRAKRSLMHRGAFHEALAWLEIHGRSPEALEHWRGFVEASSTVPAEHFNEGGEQPERLGDPRRRRRRRRRRRGGFHRRGPE
jgi:tRNA nucleotidyltransferase/poly(A) polymerase